MEIVRSRGRWGVVLAALIASIGFVSCGGGSGTGDMPPSGVISLSLVPSRISGVAPLAVFFDATLTTHTTPTIKPFHDIEYRWAFGDPAGATWSMGSRAGVSSKNSATGPLAAHVFETPGVYTVSLIGFDGVNIAQITQEITVLDPATEYAQRHFYSNDTTYAAGTPAHNGTTVFRHDSVSDFDAAVAADIATNRALYFEWGDTFTASNFSAVNVDGPGVIGANPFGSGAKPIITGTTDKIALGNSTNHDFGDWRFVDLDFAGTGGVAFNAIGAATRITLLRLAIHEHDTILLAQLSTLDSINVSSSLAAIWNQWAIVESNFTNNNAGSLIAITDSVIMGNQSIDQLGQANLRTQYAKKLVISNNDLESTPSGAALTVRSAAWEIVNRMNGPGGGEGGNEFTLPAHAYGEEIIVADNKVSGFGTTTQPFTFMAVQNTLDVRFRNIIVERNWLVGDASTSAPLISEAGLMTVRNNLLDLTISSAFAANGVFLRGNGGPSPDNVAVYNNSFYNGVTASFNAAIVNITAAYTNVVVGNNLGYAPNNTGSGTAPVNNSGGAGVTQSNNSMTSQNQGVNPNFVATPPMQPSHWRPTAGFVVNGGFAVPVFSDFFVAPRSGNHLGAVNP